MKTLITGSLAFDSIMVFEDQFKNHILPDKTHMLNVSFFTPEMRRYVGGCAGNIAYTLKLLGGDPLIMATVGEDFDAYTQWLTDNDISQQHVTTIEGQFTAQAMIINDSDNNQINAFHPGAMNFAHNNKVSDASDVTLGIVSPDGRDGMIQHAQQFSDAGIPFFFDPGQGLPMFDGDELLRFCEQADYAIFNDYESHMMMSKTGLTIEQLSDLVKVLIVTKGGEGSTVYVDDQIIHIPSAPISAVKDPTGCGDAFRAGVMFGLSKGCDWKTSAQIGTLCGAIKIEQAGTQKHRFSTDDFARRYQDSFAEPLTVFS